MHDHPGSKSGSRTFGFSLQVESNFDIFYADVLEQSSGFLEGPCLHTQLKMRCTAYTHGGTTNRSKTTPQGVELYMYLLGRKERSRVLPKHIIIKCILSLQGCELFLRNANKMSGSVVGVN